MRKLIDTYDKKTNQYTCQRCKHKFFPKRFDGQNPVIPNTCPKCRSKWWSYQFFRAPWRYEKIHCTNCGITYWSCSTPQHCRDKKCNSTRIEIVANAEAATWAEKMRLLHPERYEQPESESPDFLA